MPPVVFPPSLSSIEQAAEALQAGNLVVFPTETVYGLGGNARSDEVVAKIFALKGRPSFNPLIIHLASAAHAGAYVRWNDHAETLAKSFWPGPLTCVLPRSNSCGISYLASAGLDTLAVRVPGHPVARQLLQSCDIPLAAPSANRSGRVSPTCAAHVASEFPAESLTILDGGACAVGLESTVIDLSGTVPVLLRPGSITREQLESALGRPVTVARPGAAIASPGQLTSHYAPTLPVRVNAESPREGEAYLQFNQGDVENTSCFILSKTDDLTEAAAALFAQLRAADDPGRFTGIAVAPIPHEGPGIAINDRLRRAAAKRP